LKNQLHAIVQGAYSYKHDYFIIEKDRKLVYKENDSINYKLSYGYKTVFANLYEFGRGKISQSNLNEALCIQLTVAQFSYAILPTMFEHIIGVTGTLKAMPLVKKRVLRDDYKVKDNYLIPSSFGLNDKKDYKYIQCEQGEHFNKIVERMNNTISKRPIIVFFNNASELYEFFSSPAYTDELKNRTLILTEEHEPSVRERNVFLATQCSKISLMTKAFGRGTDFEVYDKEVIKNGGLHIIQTFLSQEEAKEVQIKGRTNRQNAPGSVDIVYKHNEL
jgi:preprotein translocase subunit SecA